jgi:hypothetical protein
MIKFNQLAEIKAVSFDDLMLQELLAMPSLSLAGSRLFAQEHPSIIQVTEFTDWDFCGEYSKELEDQLIKLGLTLHTGGAEQYCDLTTQAILTFGEMQVVLRSDCEGWMKMIHSILPEFYRDYLWKSGPNSPKKETIQAMLNHFYLTSEVWV